MKNKLPKNWVETELGEILKLKNGYAFKSKDYKEIGIPIIRISNIKQGLVSTQKSISVGYNETAENFLVKKGDVLVAMSGATTGKYGVYKENIKAYQNQRVGNLKPIIPSLISRKFIYYLLGGLKKEIEDKAYGGAQPNISAKLIETLKFNLPPKAEQERIVTKLDTIFNELETVKKSLENIPNLIKNFRQAILTQAVTGKLTEKWRVGKELETWKEVKVGSFMKEIKQKAHPNSIDETKYIGLEHIVKNRGIIGYSSSKTVKSSKTVFKKGDVLYGKLRPYLNKHDITDINGICSTDILVYRNENNNSSKFFNYFLGAGDFISKANSLSKGINLPRISAKTINNFIINIPPHKEQTEIVKRVEKLFTQADKIEQSYEQLKKQIDSLPQAILAKAFKGELVAQLPTDGNAQDLLKEIQTLKASLESKPKKKPKPF